MSWSDDMRCLFCDGKLPLYRKITSGQFCSAKHRNAYWKEQERLAVERLSQTHDSLRAYRPAEADTILATPPVVASSPLSNPFYLDGQRFEEDAVLDFARTASNRDIVTLAGFVRPTPPLASDWYSFASAAAIAPVSFPVPVPEILVTSGASPAFLAAFSGDQPVAQTIDLVSSLVPAVVERTRRVVQPLTPPTAALSRVVELGIAPEIPGLLLTRPEAMTEPVIESTVADNPVVVEPVLAETMLPETTLAVHPEIVEPEPPALAGPVALGKPAAPSYPPPAAKPIPAEHTGIAVAAYQLAHPALVRTDSLAPSMALAVALRKSNAASSPFVFSCVQAAPLDRAIPAPARTTLASEPVARTLGSAKMLALVAPRTSASASAPADASVEAISAPAASTNSKAFLAPKNLPPSGLTVPPVAERMPLANVVRYALRSGGSVPARNAVAPAEHPAGSVEIPATSLACVSSMQEPSSAWLAKLPFNVAPSALVPVRAVAANLGPVFPNGVEPKAPTYAFQPVDGSAVPPPPRSFLAFANWTPRDPSERRDAWEHVIDFWAHAPRDLKILLFAIPVLLTFALHPHLPKVHVAAPSGTASTGLGKNFQQVFTQQVNAVQRDVASRAGVALSEDFRSGLEDWQTHGDLSAAWSFDANGFVRPGSLALYRPSMRLADYDLQFLGLIDKKALSFVARAQDFTNYYVIKLVVLKPGPLPTIGITRYAVIDGKAQNRVDSIAPINAMPDMLYHVELNVHDDTYLLTLQGKVADSWSEPRLTRGGVGFFAPRGEESRVRWVQLTHQYDMLGRLCAYLAPYNIPTTNGSF